MKKLTYINGAPNAPAAIGPYSQAVVAGDLVFLSGQVPLIPGRSDLAQGIEAQTEQVMSNLAAVLKHCELEFSNVAKATIFLTDLGHFQTVNAIYERWLAGIKPARATVQVAALPKGALVEIEMIALK